MALCLFLFRLVHKIAFQTGDDQSAEAIGNLFNEKRITAVYVSEEIQVDNENRWIEDMELGIFSSTPMLAENGELILEGLTPDIINMVNEIIKYLSSGDVETACKLFLYCRGGDVHACFHKYVMKLRGVCYTS